MRGERNEDTVAVSLELLVQWGDRQQSNNRSKTCKGQWLHEGL